MGLRLIFTKAIWIALSLLLLYFIYIFSYIDLSNENVPKTITKLISQTGDSQGVTFKSNHTQNCTEVHYQHGKGHPKIALASFPGSGNTWVRNIIQLTTGLYTGSEYYDMKLMKTGFEGEGISIGVIAIKTHTLDMMEACDKAILIIRNPADAILAEFNRQKSDSPYSHINLAPPSLFNTTVWTEFVFSETEKWLHFNTKWLQFPRPLLVIHYESLQQNLTHEVLRLATFFGTPINKQHLDCVLRHSEGQFKRPQKQENRLSVYTPQMHSKLNSVLQAVQRKEDMQEEEFSLAL